ncbi:MAG: Tn3 family transposase [Alphaproteobacteria bacterium]|jgi:TnpA family transposase|nr:Tn3 family transposase [Alphaproteobacteria bacterium]
MKQRWTAEELEEFWTLHPEESKLLHNKSGRTRLSFAFMLKYFQIFYRFPNDQEFISQSIISHMAQQIGVDETNFIKSNSFSSSVSKPHRQQIREFLGFRLPKDGDKPLFIKWLIEKVLPEGNDSISFLQERAYAYFNQAKIEPFSFMKIDRYIRSALAIYEENLFLKIFESLDKNQKSSLLDLVEIQETQSTETYYLRHLKKDAGNISLESILEEVKKVSRILEVGLPRSLFNKIPHRILEKYKTRIMTERPSEIRDHKNSMKHATLSMFCCVRGQEIKDNLVDLLIQVIHKIGKNSENKVNKKLVTELKKVNGKQNILLDLARVTVANPEGIVKDVVYPVVKKETLQEIIKESQLTRGYKEQVYTFMRASYSSHYRRMLSPILETISFQSNNTLHQPVLKAVKVLKKYLGSTAIYYPANQNIPIKGVIKPGWKDIIVEKLERNDEGDKQERVNRINYEIAVLKALREGLRCKEIWVEGAKRYRNPDEDLPTDFEERREEHYLALKQPQEAEKFISKLQHEMRGALTMFNNGIPKNTKVKILAKKGGYISLSPLDAQAPPPNLEAIKKQVFERWPTVGLLDILKETNFRTSFTSVFASTASREYLDEDQLIKRLLLCIFAYGTNTGLKRISSSNPEITYEELRHIRRRYFTKTNLRAAIAEVVNAILRERDEKVFGQATTSVSSDSKKFGVWDQNLLTEWHIRYRGRGVMIYWHIDKKSVLIFSQLKSCSSSEVSSMIEGVLRHCTDMEIKKSYVDSHGQSAIGFAFSYMLGFDLLPRIKAIHKEKLYRPESGKPEEYPNLQNILTRPIRWNLIQEQYDQIVKFTTALRLGTADAESILRRFTSNNAQHPVYQALMELGKAVKTIFLCRYLDSEELRQEVQEGLNVVESSNSVNDFILYGKAGEISTNRREDQELTMLCLHLLQNSLVYINTLMLQSILSHPQWEDKLKREDKRAITALFYEHINPYGLLLLDLNQRISLDKFKVANDQRIADAA